MAYFEWADDLTIDQGPIDEDHRKLVDLVNALHAAAQQGISRSSVGERMAELIFYTQDHLIREEELMAAIGFPDLAEHKQSHILFLSHLHDYQTDFQKGDAANAIALAALLKNWLANHIREGDGELRDYLRNVEKIEVKSIPTALSPIDLEL
jgi:hemerythrin-like metal-binding protein